LVQRVKAVNHVFGEVCGGAKGAIFIEAIVVPGRQRSLRSGNVLQGVGLSSDVARFEPMHGGGGEAVGWAVDVVYDESRVR
jgi:hypothetical protein